MTPDMAGMAKNEADDMDDDADGVADSNADIARQRILEDGGRQ